MKFRSYITFSNQTLSKNTRIRKPLRWRLVQLCCYLVATVIVLLPVTYASDMSSMPISQESGSIKFPCAQHSKGLLKAVHIEHSTAIELEDTTGSSSMDCNFVYAVESLTPFSIDVSVTKSKSVWTVLNVRNSYLFVTLPSDRPPRL